MILYITEQGANISKSNNQMYINMPTGYSEKIPIRKIEKINILGNIGITTPAISYFLENKIEIIFMSYSGKYKGKLVSDEYKNVILRLEQYKRSLDENFRLNMAKDFVRGKLKNYYDMLNKKNRDNLKGKLGENLAGIRKSIESLNDKNDFNQIRGIEGIGSKIYFDGIKKIIKKEEFEFEKRIYHPPKDRVNALMSFAYSLIYNEVYAAMNAVGLDPYFGNLHEIAVSKKALLFDMVEEYRSMIDEFLIKMINRGEIKSEDFYVEEELYRFTKEGMKKFISKYEEFLSQKYKYEKDNEENYLRVIFEKQARHYSRVVLGEEKEYVSFKPLEN